MKKFKTVVKWNPSEDMERLLNCKGDKSDLGAACYLAKVVIFEKGAEQPIELPDQTILPHHCELTVECGEGARVVVLVATVNPDGIQGNASPFEFIAGPSVQYDRPTKLRVHQTFESIALPQAS